MAATTTVPSAGRYRLALILSRLREGDEIARLINFCSQFRSSDHSSADLDTLAGVGTLSA